MTEGQVVPGVASSPAPDNVRRLLAASYAGLTSCFDRAAAETGLARSDYLLAGHHVRISAAGSRLAEALKPALSHLPAASGGPAALEIFAWDEAETGVAPPELPWQWSGLKGTVRLVLPPGGEAFRVHAWEEGVMFFMFSAEANQAVFWTRDARRLPTHFRAAPFLMLIHWWSRQHGLRLVHAGSVGTESGAALIAGRGGSGKSTTCLLCALDGMDYLSDDFCLVEPGEEPRVYCLYSSGKLNRDHLERFPKLAARAVDPVPEMFEKPVIFLSEHFSEQVKVSRPLRTVIVPQVTGQPDTRLEPLSASGALRALTSSTMFQFSPDDGAAFRDMAAVLRGLPCYRLLLGSRTEDIAPAIRSVLDSNGNAMG